MAVTLTQPELSAAIRLGDNAEEVAEATRLLAFTTEAISRHLGDACAAAPEVIVNEAAIRLAGYLFDQPNAGRGLSFANAGRNSGAWTMLLPYRVHRGRDHGRGRGGGASGHGDAGQPRDGRRGRLWRARCHLGGRLYHPASASGWHGRRRYRSDCPRCSGGGPDHGGRCCEHGGRGCGPYPAGAVQRQFQLHERGRLHVSNCPDGYFAGQWVGRRSASLGRLSARKKY